MPAKSTSPTPALFGHSKVLAAQPSFAVDKLNYVLDNDNHAQRKAFKDFAAGDVTFVPRFDVR